MNIRNKILTLYIALICTGCSSFGIDGPFLNSRILEAEERMLLVTEKGLRKDDGDTIKPNTRVVCAEPSPDAIVALAASGTLSAMFGAGENAQAQGEFSKAVSELGERTPVIQLLRDSLYRSCEAYMNGLLNAEDYADILAFFDIYSITLLAIESLSHTPRPPATMQTSANSELTKSTESKEGRSESHSVSPTASSIVKPLDKSADDAENVSNILKGYYKSKRLIMYMLEAKKLSRKGSLSPQEYLDRIENFLSTHHE